MGHDSGHGPPEYAKRVNRFDWHNFYETLGGGIFFDAARRRLNDYDYVLIDSRTGVSDTLVVCFTLNHQSIKGAFAIAQSVREQRPDIRIFPLPTRIDGSEEKLLNRMKTYAADLFTPLLDKKIRASEYWFKILFIFWVRGWVVRFKSVWKVVMGVCGG